VPDASRFRADLKKSLDRIEKNTYLELAVQANTRPAEADIRKFVSKWNGESVDVDVDAKTAAASAHVATFTRRRSLDVAVEINKASLAKAATLLASLSGARVAGDMVQDLSRKLQNLDKSLPRLAAIALSIGSIGAIALSSVSGLVTMGIALSALVALAAPLPALFAGAGVAGIAFIVAMKDAGTQLSALTPLWSKLQSAISTNFWDGARKPIIDLVRTLFPQLRAGLTEVSKALGVWAGSVAGSFKIAFGGDVLAGMMKQLSTAIRNSTAGTDAFASSIAALGTFGSQYLPAIGAWFSDIAIRFNAWVSTVAADGSLQGWVSSGMTVLGQLGSSLASLGSILAGIARAASAAGGDGLNTLEDSLKAIAATVNTPLFQGALSTIFGGAADGASALGAALAPIGGMLAVLAPTIASILTIAGQAVSGFVEAVAAAMRSPIFAGGLEALFQGLQAGLEGLAPALLPVAMMIGTVATFAGALATQLGPVLGAALAVVSPLASDVLTALQPLIPVLGGALVQAIQALAPLVRLIAPLISAVVPVVSSLTGVFVTIVQLLVAGVAPVLQSLAPALQDVGQLFREVLSSILPIVTSALPQLLSTLAPIVPVLGEALVGAMQVLIPLLGVLAPIISQVAVVFAQIMAQLTPVIAEILPPLIALFLQLVPVLSAVLTGVMQIISPLLDLIAPLLQLIGPILGPLIQLLTFLIGPVLDPLTKAFQYLGPVLGGVASAISDILLPVVKSITDVLGGLITFLTGAFTGNWKQAWEGIVQIFSGVFNGIINTGKGVLNALIDIINGMIGGVNSLTASVGIPKLATIPKLASGADVVPTPGGTVVRVAEAGRAETVTDYGRTNRLIELANALAERAISSTSVSASADAGVTFYGPVTTADPTELAQAIQKKRQRSLRSAGIAKAVIT
jgi:phage-related protein